MPKHVHDALKACVPVLYHQRGLPVREICKLLGIRASTAYRALKYYQKYGVTYNPHKTPVYRRRRLSSSDLQFIRSLLHDDPTLLLCEINNTLRKRNVDVSVATVARSLARIRYTHKNVTVLAAERNELRRAAFMNHIAEIVMNNDMLMFTDESAKDWRTVACRHGWALAGQRCLQRQPFIRGERYSILLVLTLDGFMTYDIIYGSVTSARFLQFLREFVVRLLSVS
jgi:transposase